MNDIFTPPAASETACRQRGAFRSAAVEAALAALLRQLAYDNFAVDVPVETRL